MTDKQTTVKFTFPRKTTECPRTMYSDLLTIFTRHTRTSPILIALYVPTM